MTEMEEALRSCMERLVMAREEREQIIVEAANEISSEKKRVRDLQHKLEDANRKAAKLAAENGSLCKAADGKDALVRELRDSAAALGDKLADATARLESAQKQAGSLQYEMRMLQKELEVRGQEREYDLRSADAARRQQAEHLRRIAQLEGECQRLRTMVRKRLPGPAAIAKMRDEVEHQQQQQTTTTTPGASPRRPRPAAALSSPRSVSSLSPRTDQLSPRRSVSDAESYVFKLRAVEEENRALKQALAKAESELRFVQMKYADELSAVQRQLKELTEENRQLSDANCQSESWASALISELEQFRSGNQNGASIMASDMSLLDDFAEIEKMEMASGDRKRNVACASPKKADARSVAPEQNGNDLAMMNGSIPNGHPQRVHDVWKLVMHKHETSGESIDTILEKIRRALDQSAVDDKREDSDVSCDRAEIEKMVRDLVEKIAPMVHKSAEDNVARSGPLLHDKSELCRRLQCLVHVSHDLLSGKANLEKLIDVVCLILKYIVSQYFSNQDSSDTVDSNTKDFDEGKSLSTINTEGQHDSQSAKPAVDQQGPIQSAEGQILNSRQEKLDKELTRFMLAQDDNILPGRKSMYCEIESPAAEASVENWVPQEENQFAAFQQNSEILAAADKLAECQETITILSKQLHALKIPATSGPLDSSMSNPRPSLAMSDYKPQSLASILAEEFGNAEGYRSPAATPKQVQFKNEEDELYATPKRSIAQDQNADVDDKDSTQIVVRPVFAEPRQDDVSADPRKKNKKRGQSLLGRIMFRKKVEGGS